MEQEQTIYGVDNQNFVETKATNAALPGNEKSKDGHLQLLHDKES